ncbi:hypothetical protein [Sinorhizobium meliloti]|uniref:hypothetical protein n=1 Tax=Rhizobium meliloti TaxID=382 RepID=UPI0001E4AB67|nr:hypothetical protein [Sinorhizobium meliloti]AEG53156.1 hypothetical protein Sinme_1409 [Sinorhizobium meliloti AK83]MDE4591129.1 hypothetical protein [Sinorhizobium meliloti]SEI56221.1 hypothetical protein SAMN04244575_01057 [Sinorhizobium meliloti]
MIAFLHRIIRPKLKRVTKIDFVPVIFANGVDDDLPGLVAAIKNERVQFDEKIIEVGEPVIIHKRSLALSCRILYIAGHGKSPPYEFGPGEVFVTEGNPSRRIHISNCDIFMNITPRM